MALEIVTYEPPFAILTLPKRIFPQTIRYPHYVQASTDLFLPLKHISLYGPLFWHQLMAIGISMPWTAEHPLFLKLKHV